MLQVVELMLWNGNVELLTHIAFVFEHQFSGKTNVQLFSVQMPHQVLGNVVLQEQQQYNVVDT